MRIRIFFSLLLFIPSLLFSDILLFYGKQKTSISTIKKNGWVYVSLNGLNKVLNLSITKEYSSRRYTLHLPQHTLVFVENNPFYLIDDKPKKMFLPLIAVDQSPFVSLPDIEMVFGEITDEEVFVLCRLNSIVIGKSTFNPDSVIVEQENDKLSFTLTSQTELLTSIDDDKKGKLTLTLHNAVCKPTIIPPADGKGAIKKILLLQESDRAILTFLYNAKQVIRTERKLIHPGPCLRISFFLKKKTLPIETKPEKKRYINKIVLDPGHGGKDPGAVGPSGLTEKEIVLKISKELKKILQKKGFTVLMTRENDSFLRLRERSTMANNSAAHLFISIHCNASGINKEATGFETYFLSTAKTSWARAVEAKENAVIEFETPAEKESILEYILWDLAQNEYLRESSELADYIQDNMSNYLSLQNRGVKQANFHVMREIYMPSVLVEAAFISNPEEEKKLKKAKFRKTIAEGIANGILEFKKIYEKKLNQ
jgi:N-acetylmuramoyl-L-alanine amidase